MRAALQSQVPRARHTRDSSAGSGTEYTPGAERLQSHREPQALDVTGHGRSGPEQWQQRAKHGDSSAIPETTRGTCTGQRGSEAGRDAGNSTDRRSRASEGDVGQKARDSGMAIGGDTERARALDPRLR